MSDATVLLLPETPELIRSQNVSIRIQTSNEGVLVGSRSRCFTGSTHCPLGAAYDVEGVVINNGISCLIVLCCSKLL